MSEQYEDSAFHPDNINKVQLITLARIYDVLVTMAVNQAGEDQESINRIITLLHAHEMGEIKMASPAFRM
jgi:hypothetical protein